MIPCSILLVIPALARVYVVLATSLMYKLRHDPENNNVEDKKTNAFYKVNEALNPTSIYSHIMAQKQKEILHGQKA